jgi:hypothetical protein
MTASVVRVPDVQVRFPVLPQFQKRPNTIFQDNLRKIQIKVTQNGLCASVSTSPWRRTTVERRKVSGQIHALATLTPGKEHPILMSVGTQEGPTA